MKLNMKALLAGLLGASFAGVALAAGLWTGFPAAPAPVTPLTGLEFVGFDTGLPNGLNPATEQISTGQIMMAVATMQLGSSTNSSTTSTTLTTANETPGPVKELIMSGTLAGAATATTTTAAAWIAALPASFLAQPQQQYTWVIQNASSGAFAWTLAGGTSVTIVGNAVVNQNAISTWTVAVNQTLGTVTVTRVN